MNGKRILSLLLAIVMLTAMFAACGGSEEPAATTPGTTAATTAATTEATTAATTAATTTEATTTEATTEYTGYNGYEFVLANPAAEMFVNEPSNSLEEELMDIYAALEEELDITFSVTAVETPEEAILTHAMSGDKLADFINCSQRAWAPAAVNNAIRDLNTEEVFATGLNVNDEGQFDQVYTQLANLHDGSIWGCAMAGKYFINNIGFTYVFNKPLLEQHGYKADDIYQAVRDYEWDWELFMEIAATISNDTDGDGRIDVHGQTMVDIESELESNGIGLMYFDEGQGKWQSGFATPQIIESLTFVLTIATDLEYSYADAPDNTVRRATFYEGNAAFGCLYGGHYGSGGANEMCEFDYGIVPIPKGPQAEKYSYVIPDLNVFVLQNANKDWVTSCEIMARLATELTDKEAEREFLKTYLRDDESLEVLEDYCFPGARAQATRFSPDIKNALDQAAYLVQTMGPAAAIETVHSSLQAAIDALFGY